MSLETTAKRIHKISLALGYARGSQITGGWEGELERVRSLVDTAKRKGCVSSGGFNYNRTKNGSVKITLDTSFIIK